MKKTLYVAHQIKNKKYKEDCSFNNNIEKYPYLIPVSKVEIAHKL